MNGYIVIAVIFTLGLSMFYVPLGYAQDNKDSSFTYYERTCNNDTCVVTTCGADKSCSTTDANNASNDNEAEEPGTEGGNSNPKTLNMTKFWEKFMDFGQD